jgi:hypothetical protein
MTMRVRSAFSEAWRNVGTRGSRPLLSFMLFIIVVGSLALFDLYGIKAILTESRAFSSSGASITTLIATGEVEGPACDGLSDLKGVRAVGAIGAGEPVRFLSLPSSAVPRKLVTHSFINLLENDSDASVAGVFLSSDLATALSADVGDTLSTQSGDTVVAGIFSYPDDGRTPGLGWAVLETRPSAGMFDECWMDVLGTESNAANFLLTAVAPNPSEPPSLGQLNTTLGSSFDGRAEFLNRSSAVSVFAAGAFGLLLGFMSKRPRRLELASALHVGIPKTGLILQVQAEEVLWLIAANTVVLGACAWAVQSELDIDAVSVFLSGLRTSAVGTIGVLIGATVAVLFTREKHLFKYFKDR